jgi:hypothetical protein
MLFFNTYKELTGKQREDKKLNGFTPVLRVEYLESQLCNLAFRQLSVLFKSQKM